MNQHKFHLLIHKDVSMSKFISTVIPWFAVSQLKWWEPQSELGLSLNLYRSFFFFDVGLSIVNSILPSSTILKLLLTTGSSAVVIFLGFCMLTVYPLSVFGTNSALYVTSQPNTRSSQKIMHFCNQEASMVNYHH